MQSLIGTRLGPYEIVAALGAGGMGEVYKARDSRLNRDVAIKVLPSELASNAAALARFEREARAVAALNHPNILALHDVGTDRGVAHAVMELLEGETLRKRLESGPLPPRKALEWAAQLARGLAAAHERGIVHRDLKPDNVFVTKDGRIKILDFGIARLEAAEGEAIGSTTTTLTGRGQFLGTPAYASPEQVTAAPATARSDLFSYGIVVYEMLTGKNPFTRETAVETMTAILREEPPPLAGAVAGAPAAALHVIERCLEKDPSNRVTSARDVAMFLDAASGTSVEPVRALSAGEARGAERRLQLKVLAASCGLLLAVVAATWGYVQATTGRAVDEALARDLELDQGLVGRVQGARLERLQLTARLIASFPNLKALFDSTDAATVSDFLLSYQQQNPGTPLLVALGQSGTLLGETGTADLGATARGEDWARVPGNPQGEPSLAFVSDRPYHVAIAPAAAGGTIFGYVVAAAPVDQTFARAIAEATGDDAVLLSESAVLGSTLTTAQPAWKSLADWRRQGGRSDRASAIDVGGRRFAAREVVLAPQPAVSAVIARSRDDALEPFRRIQRGLVIIGLAGLVAALLVAIWLYRSLGRRAHA